MKISSCEEEEILRLEEALGRANWKATQRKLKLDRLYDSALWAYQFMTKEGTHPDDGEQWVAIAESLRVALGREPK